MRGRVSSVCPRGHDKGGTGRCYICWRAQKSAYRQRMRLQETQQNHPGVIHELARKAWLRWI